jgi:hypothetical protein
MLKRQIRSQNMYWGLARGLTTTNRRCWRRWRRLAHEATELDGRRTVVKTLSSHAKCFQKAYSPSPGAESQRRKVPEMRRGKTLTHLDVFFGGGRWVIYYREVKPISPCVSNLNQLSPRARGWISVPPFSHAQWGMACTHVWCFSSLPHHIDWRSGDNLHIYVGYPTPPLAR